MSPEFKKKQQQMLDYEIVSNKTGQRVGEMMVNKDTPNEYNLVWIGVNAKQRGSGYAQDALKSTLDALKKNGGTKFTLEVPGDSPDARHIYEKFGFKDAGKLSDEDDIWGGLTKMVLDTTKKGRESKASQKFSKNSTASLAKLRETDYDKYVDLRLKELRKDKSLNNVSDQDLIDYYID